MSEQKTGCTTEFSLVFGSKAISVLEKDLIVTTPNTMMIPTITPTVIAIIFMVLLLVLFQATLQTRFDVFTGHKRGGQIDDPRASASS